jgi:hypothetical protein
MNETGTFMNTKIVYIASEVPETVVKSATLAVVTGYGWHIFGAKRAHSFDKFMFPLPELTCTVLDISQISGKQAQQATELIADHTDGTIDELIDGLMKLGATKK